MQTLYITDGTVNSIVQTMLNSYGIPFDAITLPIESVFLEDETGALYNSIVIEGATSSNFPESLKAQIEEYQKKYSIRAAYLNCEPDTSKGFAASSPVSTVDGASLTSEGISMAEELQMKGKDVIFEIPNSSTDSAGVVTPSTHYLATITEKENFVEFMKYNNNEASCAGAIYKKDGVCNMYLFIPFIDSIAGFFTSHFWINWTSNGIVNGFRRIYLGVQVDDYFADNVINALLNQNRTYRTTIDDMKGISDWQKTITNRMPKGSFYKTELAINSIPILVAAEHKQYEIRNWELTPQEDAYIKPLNEIGDQRWSGNEDTDWDPEALKKDTLYNYFAKNQETQQDFFWLTHTFSHENLDYASKFDVENEIGLNIKMANTNYLDMYDKDYFSQNSIVCPEISGLHNGHCLEAFHEYNVFYGVGDTSRADITNMTNPYIPMMTTMETSNFEGFMVIPRQPTQVYWDIDTVEGTVAYYNNFYQTNATWNEILDREALHVTKLFLQLRHDPYMFHEGNLRNADFQDVTINGATGHYGLLQQWVERIVEEITKYVDWPIISLKMDDLAQTYIKRMDRIKCNPEYRIIVNEDTRVVQSIEIQASGACEVPLFLSKGGEIDKSSVDSIEQFGNDPKTAWIKLNGAPKSVKFVGDLLWDGDTQSFWNNQDISKGTQNSPFNDITKANTTTTENTPINQNTNNEGTSTKVIASITYSERSQEPTVDIIVPSNVQIQEASLPAHVKVTHSDTIDSQDASFFNDPDNIPVLIWKWGWDSVKGYWETWTWEKVSKPVKRFLKTN
ncbi:hypothetical protein BCR36DRAFT_579152 [Piromyces finnis]|uniref:Uncharacterized protein n=1 Tax=Piromyces finnis TaxID=1754191 RepID=A0A1Y1VPM7_9FUNG|nr:hypothetical protein BCR36DRAFT_579152 [Piromyces finnis]|eukprot:ORX61092.1 hypothetical protein BCR36DRAFT_579152 [Piromyces finnis]